MTPSLNKSFKFQSEWPYNNSQSYLLQVILSDINNDSEREFSKTDDGYIITTKVNYSNNDNLVKQKVYIDKNANINKVEVIDSNSNVKMKMTYNSIDLNSTFKDDYFKLENCMKSSNNTEVSEPVSNINEVIFPMYLPENTYLSSQDTINLDYGERVILTFAGDKPFILLQETINNEEDISIPTFGEPLMVLDSIGSVSDTSINWISNGVEYYVSSNSLSKKELLSVANSLSVMPVGK